MKRLNLKILGEKDSVSTSTKIAVYGGTAIDFVYALSYAVTGAVYSSAWFGVNAVYYSLLALMHTAVIYACRSKSENGLLKYKFCGFTAVFLLVLSVPICFTAFLTVTADTAFKYPFYTIYAAAAYTFYNVIRAVVDFVKSRKNSGLIYLCAVALNFVTAAVSVLGLQNALIAAFSEYPDTFKFTMNLITGTVVCVSVIVTALYMFGVFSRAKRRYENE